MPRRNRSSDLEVDVASQVQQLLFPKNSPVCNWCCIGTKNRMAQGLGGDFFDFITMPDGCQAVFIGDVTGHGLHASVVMSLLYGFIHRASKEFCSPTKLIGEVNAFLQSFADRSRELDHFFSATLFCASIDPESMAMGYVNAGHPAPLVKRGDEILRLPATGPPVGYFDHPEFHHRSFQFLKEDRCLLFTDGITEACNSGGEGFGNERLIQALRNRGGDHLEFLDQLFAELRDFGADDPPEDDCTAIVLDFHGQRL